MPDEAPSLPERQPRPGLWHWLGHQLARPEGRGGALLGHLMARANAKPGQLAIAALHPARRDFVLEIGFGPGVGIATLAEEVSRGHVAGIDGSAAMLRLASRRNRRAVASGHVELVEGDFRRLPWADGSFDGVLAVNVAYFFDAEGRALREIARVLRPGGRLALYVTDRSTMQHWPFAGADTHVTFDAGDLAELLHAGGFPKQNINICPVALPFGVNGLVAVARRARGLKAASAAGGRRQDEP